MKTLSNPELLYKTFFQMQLGRSSNVNPHAHDFFELVYVLDGTCTQIIDNKTIKTGAGDYFVLERGIPHEYHHDGSPNFLIANCLFSPRLISRSFSGQETLAQVITGYVLNYQKSNHWESPAQTIFHDEDGEIRRIIMTMFREYRTQPLGYLETIRSNLTTLLLLMLRSVTQNKTTSKNSSIAQEILDFIECNYNQQISLRDISTRFHYSTNYTCRIIKEQVGTTFSDYLQKVRIENACLMLRSTNESIKIIALACGFNDNAFFHRIFKKHMGMTPGDYRDQARQEVTSPIS